MPPVPSALLCVAMSWYACPMYHMSILIKIRLLASEAKCD
jgi:hypothetical protein